MTDFFAVLGLAVSIILMLITIIGLLMLIHDKIKCLRYRYKYNHRFDQKLIAKCYCKDCIHRCTVGESGNYCRETNRYAADHWFCWKAVPRAEDPDKDKG